MTIPGEAFLSEHDRGRFDPLRRALAAVVATLLTLAIVTAFAASQFSASTTTAAAKSPGMDAYFTSSTRPPTTDETGRMGSGGGLSGLWEVN